MEAKQELSSEVPRYLSIYRTEIQRNLIMDPFLPRLEIRLAETLRTTRRRREDREAKFVMLFPERSSLSKLVHSPIHPRSCIPEAQTHT